MRLSLPITTFVTVIFSALFGLLMFWLYGLVYSTYRRRRLAMEFEAEIMRRGTRALRSGEASRNEVRELVRDLQAVGTLRQVPRATFQEASRAPRRPGPAADEQPSAVGQLFAFPQGEGEVAQLGYRIFKWLLVLAALLLAALGIYAWRTYPSLSSISNLLPANATATDRMDAWQNLRTAWLQQVKDLGQLFVLTPVFPLIAAVIGYIFGVRKAAREVREGDQRSFIEPTELAVPRDGSND